MSCRVDKRESQRDLCSNGEESWCGYIRDKDNYKHKNGIPVFIVKVIKSIFDDLSETDSIN